MLLSCFPSLLSLLYLPVKEEDGLVFVLFVWHHCSFKQLTAITQRNDTLSVFCFVIHLSAAFIKTFQHSIDRDDLLQRQTNKARSRLFFVPTVLPGYFIPLGYAALLWHFVFFIMESDRKSEGRRGHAGKVMSQIAIYFQTCIFVQRDPPLLPLISPSPTLSLSFIYFAGCTAKGFFATCKPSCFFRET